MKKQERGKKRKGKRIFLIVIIVAVVAFFFSILASPISENVALIKIKGTILTEKRSFFPYSATYSDEIIKAIESASGNPNIKAILLEINSPGGSAVASAEIANAIKKAKKKKLVVALIREQATSGAYWVASSFNYIVASPLSITGSIGVLANYLEIAGLLEKLNITYRRLNQGKYKDILSPYKKLSEEEKKLIEAKLKIIHDTFIKEVAENRNLSEERVENIANGLFYLGKEAKELGLIDKLGSKDEALAYIEKKLKIKARIKEYKKAKGILQSLSELAAKQAFWLGTGIGVGLKVYLQGGNYLLPTIFNEPLQPF